MGGRTGKQALLVWESARTLATFVKRAHSPYVIVLSENDFSKDVTEGGVELRRIPLYAAHCLGEGFVKAE